MADELQAPAGYRLRLLDDAPQAPAGYKLRLLDETPPTQEGGGYDPFVKTAQSFGLGGVAKEIAKNAEPVQGPPKEMNPLVTTAQAFGEGVSRIGQGLSELNPFPKDRPRDPIGGTLQTGKGLADIGLGAFGAVTSPYTGVSRAAGNIAERATGGLMKSEQVQTALGAIGSPKGMQKVMPPPGLPARGPIKPPVEAPPPAAVPKAPEGYRLRELPEAPLVPARQLPGGAVDAGLPGQKHKDLLAAEGTTKAQTPPDQLGFAKPTGEFLSREQAAKEAGAPVEKLHTSDLAAQATPEERITRALADPANRDEERVYLSSIRRALSDLPPEEQNRAIQNYQRPGVALMRFEHPRWITEEHKASAVPVGDQMRHYFYVTEEANLPHTPKSVGAAGTGYPEASAGGPEGAQSLIRQRVGFGERARAQAEAALEPFHARVNKMSEPERLQVIDYLEDYTAKGGVGGFNASTLAKPEQEAVESIRKIYQDAEFKMGGTPTTEDMNFVRDYYRHVWTDPKKADQFFSAFSGKEGSARGAGKKRSIPTIADGIKAGLVPKDTNYVSTTLDYANHINRFNAMNEVYDIAREQKAIKFFQPGKEPEGWKPIEGRRGGKTPYGMAPYAPEKFANDYNNFVSQGFQGKTGEIVRDAKTILNNATAFKLGISGFHAATMTQEALASDFARTIDNLSYGRPAAAAKSFGRAMTGVGPSIGQVMRGRAAKAVYLGKPAANSEEARIVDYLTQANMKMVGLDKSWRQSSAGNFWSAWKHGALQAQLVNKYADIANAPLGKKPIEAVKGVFNLASRALETASAPLFEWYIPNLKRGAAMETLGDWMKAHPSAAHEDILYEARRIVDSIDNRFGEMNHDNIFWNQKLKDAAQMSFLSYSWTFGSMRELGGGVKDVGKLALGSKEWTRRASYIIGLPLAAAYMGAVYQTLKTGKPPENARDLYAPKTGGMIPGDFFHGPEAERAEMPGYMKEIYNVNDVLHDRKTVQDVVWNKLNPLLKTVWQVLSKKDWRNDPIRDANAAYDKQVWQTLGFALKALGEPISFSQWEKMQPGSGISPLETFVGLKSAPGPLQNPEQSESMFRSFHQKEWLTKLSHDATAAQKVGDKKTFDALQKEIALRKTEMERTARQERLKAGGQGGRLKSPARLFTFRGPIKEAPK